MANNPCDIWLEIDGPAAIKHREAGTQQRISFEMRPEFIGMDALVIIGGLVDTGKNNETINAHNPATLKTVTVGNGNGGMGRVRVTIPNNQRGANVYVVVVP